MTVLNPSTSDDYRAAAYYAGRRGDYAEAARLYDAAADAHPKTGKGSRVNVAKMRADASAYRRAAAYRAELGA